MYTNICKLGVYRANKKSLKSTLLFWGKPLENTSLCSDQGRGFLFTGNWYHYLWYIPLCSKKGNENKSLEVTEIEKLIMKINHHLKLRLQNLLFNLYYVFLLWRIPTPPNISEKKRHRKKTNNNKPTNLIGNHAFHKIQHYYTYSKTSSGLHKML